LTGATSISACTTTTSMSSSLLTTHALHVVCILHADLFLSRCRRVPDVPFNHPRLCFSLGSIHLGHQRWVFSLRIRPCDLVWLIYGVCFTSPEVNSELVGRISVDVHEGCPYDDRNTTALVIFLSSFRHIQAFSHQSGVWV